MNYIKKNVIELCKLTDAGIHKFVSDLVKKSYKRYTITVS